MIDYSNYNLAEMQAIVTVLDDLTDEMSVQEFKHDYELALCEFMRASARAKVLINQQARDHAADDPAPDMFGWVGDALDGLHV